MIKICKNCAIELTLDSAYWRKDRGKFGNLCKKCFNLYCADRWRKKKVLVIESLGGKCTDCLISYHYSVYDIHHLDPSKKDVEWAKMRMWSPARAAVELDKCVLLCSNCHRIRHYGPRSI